MSQPAKGFIVGGVVAIIAIPVLLGACSQKAREPFRDSPTAPERNEAPARIITMPDGFSNVAGKCDGPNYLYSGYHGNDNRMSIAVAPNDPRCRG